jgi:N-acyl-D-aspartate/D-glutamate deacylase
VSSPFDTIIRGGLVFDGLGAPPVTQDVGIRAGRIAAVSPALPSEDCPEVLDGRGRWVLPGFVDVHTHYDAEVLVNPGLPESVRHGVTTVIMGNCSLSTVYADPVDCADLFSRVEAVPRQHVLAALREHRTWSDAHEYVAALDALPLGPNLTAMLGHSDLRAHVLGLGRAVDPRARPTSAEQRRMEQLLGEAIDAGLIGLSTMTSPFSRLDGDRYRSARLPSTYASWREYRRLNNVLRARDAVLQSAPNTAMPVNMVLFMLASSGFGLRGPLRTTLLTAIDPKSAPAFATIPPKAARLVNRFGRANLRWQHLPLPFELYSDGIDLVIFEEFGATAAALHLRDEVDRRRLLDDQRYRSWFRKEYTRRFPPKAWHRDLHDAEIVACPDGSLVGRTFGEVADERAVHPVDGFLDLVVAHDHRQPPARDARSAGGRRGHPDRLRGLRRAPAQHGLLQLPAAAAETGARRGRRGPPVHAAGAGGPPADRRAGAVVRPGGRHPAGGRPGRRGGDRPGRPRRVGRRLPRSADGGLRRAVPDGQPQRPGGRGGLRGRDHRVPGRPVRAGLRRHHRHRPVPAGPRAHRGHRHPPMRTIGRNA